MTTVRFEGPMSSSLRHVAGVISAAKVAVQGSRTEADMELSLTNMRVVYAASQSILPGDLPLLICNKMLFAKLPDACAVWFTRRVYLEHVSVRSTFQ